MSQATLSDRPYANSNLFSGHYLDERIQDRAEWECDEAARAAMEELQELYDLESGLVDGYGEDALVDNWIDEVLDVLGFGTNVETTLPDGGGYVDVLLFEDADARRDAAEVYLQTEATADLFDRSVGLVEAKQWDADFTARFNKRRPYRNASHQIKHYLEQTPESIQWGILTNGRKWRLYGTKDYETQTYYEIDLPELLERGDLEAFKHFFVFFRPEAFRETGGTTFLDSVRSESETVAQELGEDLQDNVFTALRVLGRGFAETNDLEIDPDDDEALAELKEQSLVLLYRLMFVLYAESRGLIHPEGQDAVAEYEENFSLDALRLEIHEEIGEVDDGFDAYSEHSTTMWSKLEDLFRLVDEGEASLGIPPYNGGLFNRENHAFLTDHEVSNRHLAEVIYRISTTENDEGRYVLADYADLDTRHLGSVYEGLLEHQFRIAPEAHAAVTEDGGQVWKPATEVSVADAVETVEEGELYVVNDEGERKATGAYYTPDYVVTYIVEETVGPLIEEIRADLESQGFEPGTHEYLGAFYRRVTDLKILDPAMGSGHFLTRATEYLAQQVMAEVRELEEATAFDEQRVRRDVAKECIYGVDLNGMAVELAKLSMWLETLAADQPLAFLDHHLKAGNSLVGSDVTEVLSSESESEGGQLTLQQALARVRQDTLEHVMDRMQELLEIDNESLADVKSMEEIYDEVRADAFYQRLFELTNVHTAERFDLEVPEGAYERMARAIDDEDEWEQIEQCEWYREAQRHADASRYFHWELEYPEVFFDDEGEKRKDAGFDAVIGNPPWMDFQKIEDRNRRYQRDNYQSAEGKYDLYVVFVERGLGLLSADSGEFGFIIQNRFLTSDYGSGIKNVLCEQSDIKALLDFEDANIFAGTTTYPLILLASEKSVNRFEYVHLENASEQDVSEFLQSSDCGNMVSTDKLDPNKTWIYPTSEQQSALESISDAPTSPLQDLTKDISTGVKTNLKEAYVFESPVEEIPIEKELLRPVLDGGDIRRYSSSEIDKYIVYPYQEGEDTPTPINLDEYPLAKNHFNEYEDELRSRLFYEKTVTEMGKEWFEFPYTSESLLQPKVLFPDISPEPRATYDSVGEALILNTAYGAVLSEDTDLSEGFICGLFNSKTLRFAFSMISPKLSGGYYRFQTQYVGQLPIIDINEDSDDYTIESSSPSLSVDTLSRNIVSEYDWLGGRNWETHDIINDLASEMVRLSENKDRINLDLFDHLGSYSDGQSIADIGLAQPPAGAADSILTDTADDRENLRVGDVEIERESPTSLEIRLTARYKPEDEDEHETDRWGYTETDPLPALEITELTETEADLLEAFVPVAVDEAGGFANFRENATKTNSLVDRLRKLTLPAVDDVRDGLESYLETEARAEELEDKIEKTDELIDEIVYELYGLTDEEIEIVEEAVGE